MFFLNTLKKKRILRKLSSIFETTYEIKHNYKLTKKFTCEMYFIKNKVAVIFGEYDNTDKNIIEIENSDIKIFNIPENENIFTTAGRLLYVLKGIIN